MVDASHPSFCIPDVNQPTCSKFGSNRSWTHDREKMKEYPCWNKSVPSLSPTDSGASTSSSMGSSLTPSTEEDYSESDSICGRIEEIEIEDEKRLWIEKVEQMTDEELEYVERAHRKSRILEIYKEPSLRFYCFPSVRFVLPVVSLMDNVRRKKGYGPPPPIAPNTHFPPLETTDPKQLEEPRVPSPPPSDPVDPSGQFEVSKMDVLSEQIWHFHNKVTQKESTLEKKLALRNMLYYAISPIFPMCGLYVVGSSLNGFGNDNSDMDLCLMITNKDLDQKTDAVVVLNMILSTLQRMDWVTHQKLILAKVPILRIKFAAPFNDITVDLNANNSVAIKNTHLLCYYSSFDWRVRPLISIVKEWARRKGINDANRSSFTSYSLVLMVIHYLQCGSQPVLPSLQQKYPKRFNARADVRTLNVTQPLANHEIDWDYQDKSTLGELLLGFFKYFSSKFDYNSQAISIREGKLISRTQVTRSRNNYTNNPMWRSQWRCICIEEPFTFNNTAHSIYDEMVFNAIKKSFEEAHDKLEKTRDIDCLLNCTPITAAPPNHGATAYIYDGVSREATLEAGALMHGRGSTSSGIQLSGSDSNISINSVDYEPSSKMLNTINESEKENLQRPTSSCSQHSQASVTRRPYSRNNRRKGHHGGSQAQTRQQCDPV